MSRRLRAPLAALASAALLAGCGSQASSTTTEPPSTGPTHSTPTTSAPTRTSGPTTSSSTTKATPGGPSGGTSTSPAPVTPVSHPLSWKDVGGSTEDAVTVGSTWRVTVVNGGARALLTGPTRKTIPAGTGYQISDAYLDDHDALVVSEDKLAQKPDVATVVDLATGRTTTLNGSSTPPTSVGGTWALGQGRVVHATPGPDHAYCLASVDLTSGTGTTGYCVPPRHGFSRATITPDGETLLTFDAGHPSCRTPVTVNGSSVTPLPGVTACKGWDSAALPGGAIWSVTPNPNRIEAAHFYARSGTGWFDLGAGTSGSLVVCGDAAYFARDPSGNADPATLLRWTPDGGLATVFASKGTGNAFLAPPRCGGTRLTLNAYAAAGDQEVTAPVG
jgi:hypothetical protein